MISDAHEGIKAAVARVFRASWQRCRVHFMRNALAHAGRSGRRVVSAFIATAFAQDDAGAARAQWRQVADQVRTKLPKLAALLDEAEADVLAYMTFPKEHRAKIHSTDEIDKRNCCLTSGSSRMAWHRLLGAARRATFDESGEARREAGQDEPGTGGAPARRVADFGRQRATKCS